MTTPAQLPVHCGWKEIQFNSRSVYMKKTIFNGAVLLSVLLCFSLVLFAACDTGTSGDYDDTETPIENPVDDPADDPADDPTDDPADDPASPTAPSAPQLDFESANIATLISSSTFEADMGDLRATWDDADSFGDAVSDMVFSADSSRHASGSASLKVTATALQNHHAGPNYDTAQWVFRTYIDRAGLASPVDLTGKTVSLKALVPTSGTIMAVKLVLWDENWNQSQGTGIAIDSKDTWSTVSYKYGDPSDYTSADGDGNILFNIEKVTICKRCRYCIWCVRSFGRNALPRQSRLVIIFLTEGRYFRGRLLAKVPLFFAPAPASRGPLFERL